MGLKEVVMGVTTNDIPIDTRARSSGCLERDQCIWNRRARISSEEKSTHAVVRWQDLELVIDGQHEKPCRG
jgi:hypothetical protein